MSKLPRLSGKDVLRLFERHGWSIVRIQGSHHILRSKEGKIAVVPLHGNTPLHTGILSALLRKHLKISLEKRKKGSHGSNQKKS